MKKAYLILLALSAACVVRAQYTQTPTQSFTIKGHVKNALTITTEIISAASQHTIGDIVITNHKGEHKSTAKGLTGVLLKDLLQAAALDNDNPKIFSEYYYILEATDGYKVVYSWNELFNTATGDNVFIVTNKDNQSLEDLPESILVISPHDFKTGRRYLKSLKDISVGRVD